MINCRLLIAGLALAAACSRNPEMRTYQLKGQVLAVDVETREILVKHEDIPGFMPAMTMPYLVKDAALIRDRVPGDLITATLTVEPDLAHLSAITRTGSAPVPADARTTIPAAANIRLLKDGDRPPAVRLIDQDETPISLDDFRGLATAVTFIYTRCPLPQFCPVMDRRFAETQALIVKDRQLHGRVRLLTISFDPKVDRAAVLRAHARTLGADPSLWRFATADEAVVNRFAATFGVNVIRETDGTITHNLRTAVIDSSGKVAGFLDHNAWTAEDLVQALRAALGR